MPTIRPPLTIRSSFAYDRPLFWYPSHQGRALKQLRDGIHHIDLVVEVRDARIPLTSINPKFESLFEARDKLIVYNKADLANPNLQKVWILPRRD
jgi:ribosome biogenesis GTPase A